MTEEHFKRKTLVNIGTYWFKTCFLEKKVTKLLKSTYVRIKEEPLKRSSFEDKVAMGTRQGLAFGRSTWTTLTPFAVGLIQCVLEVISVLWRSKAKGCMGRSWLNFSRLLILWEEWGSFFSELTWAILSCWCYLFTSARSMLIVVRVENLKLLLLLCYA